MNKTKLDIIQLEANRCLDHIEKRLLDPLIANAVTTTFAQIPVSQTLKPLIEDVLYERLMTTWVITPVRKPFIKNIIADEELDEETV